MAAPEGISLIDELRRILSADQVVSDPSELIVYESDGFTIARAIPQAVVFPTSTAQVAQVVRLLADRGVQIIPRGSGTGLTGGCTAYENGVLVSTVRMNRVMAIDLDSRVAHVQAGVRNTALSDAVARLPEPGSAYHFAPDPSSQRASTIGGNASTNAGGIHTLKDFVTSNHVLGMEMVLSDGSIVTVGGTGGCYEPGPFDLPGLICGHEGTLGLVTSLWVRLVPKAKSFRTAISLFATRDDACSAVSQVIASGLLPAAMEMLDSSMLRLIEGIYHFGFPDHAQALVLTEIDGIEALLDGQMEQVAAICRQHNAISVQASGDPAVRAKLWKARKSAFGAIGKISPSYCTQDACVPRSKLREVLQRVDEIGREHGLALTNVFHAGDGNVHPIFMYDDRDQAQVQNVLVAAEKMLKYCIDIGGTLTGEHGVGVEKIHLVPHQFDAATMGQFARVKCAFDPGERINAGKHIPSDKVCVTLLKPGRHVPQ
jgi:glycolate oxidase